MLTSGRVAKRIGSDLRRLGGVRTFSAVTVTQSSGSAPLPNNSNNRLDALRSQLAQENPEIDDFPNTSIAYNATSDSNSDTIIPRKKAPPRSSKILPKPKWLKAKPPADSATYHRLRQTVRDLGLATVCEEARCPNIGDCWGGDKDGHAATATIMIMGDTCTRGCRFCSVATSKAPPPLDPEEPVKVATAIAQWGLDYVVLTSVDRDDLADQGANHFRQVVQQLKLKKPTLLVEALTPDFQGDLDLVRLVATSGLDVFAHNIETIERLTPRVRDRRAKYHQSMRVLESVKSFSNEEERQQPILTKTSIMLGLGETDDEILQTLKDLRSVDVDVVTFGQYLQPTRKHLPVQHYVTPEKFEEWQHIGEEMGFKYVASGPLVRSSYKAGEFFLQNYLREQQQQDNAVAS